MKFPVLSVRRGKVRDVYDFGDRLLFVASDRISAFDWVLPNGIPDKGRVLTKFSEMWFGRLDVPHHFLSMNLDALPLPAGIDRDGPCRPQHGRQEDAGRADRMRRPRLSVRLGLEGISKVRRRCGIGCRPACKESDRLEEPIFTPATKEESGHDINISFEQMCEIVGRDTSERLRNAELGDLSPRCGLRRARKAS